MVMVMMNHHLDDDVESQMPRPTIQRWRRVL